MMMVNPYDDSRLMLALQIDHSRVAGFFAAHWGNRDFARPEPYASVVLAAHEHDIGWWEWEMKPSTLNDKGFPMDYHDGSFKYLGQLRLDFYKNAVERVLKRDPYAALLMAMPLALMAAIASPNAPTPGRTIRSDCPMASSSEVTTASSPRKSNALTRERRLPMP
jgi:hypothetical protein